MSKSLGVHHEHPWQRYLNEQHEEYYYNSLTDEATRHRPRELNAVVSAMRRSGQRQIQNVSSERISAGGRSNSTTGATTTEADTIALGAIVMF